MSFDISVEISGLIFPNNLVQFMILADLVGCTDEIICASF